MAAQKVNYIGMCPIPFQPLFNKRNDTEYDICRDINEVLERNPAMIRGVLSKNRNVALKSCSMACHAAGLRYHVWQNKETGKRVLTCVRKTEAKALERKYGLSWHLVITIDRQLSDIFHKLTK